MAQLRYHTRPYIHIYPPIPRIPPRTAHNPPAARHERRHHPHPQHPRPNRLPAAPAAPAPPPTHAAPSRPASLAWPRPRPQPPTVPPRPCPRARRSRGHHGLARSPQVRHEHAGQGRGRDGANQEGASPPRETRAGLIAGADEEAPARPREAVVNQPASQPVTASIDGLTDCGRWAAREEIVRKHEARVESSQKVQDLLWVPSLSPPPLFPLPPSSPLTPRSRKLGTVPTTNSLPASHPPPPQYMRAGHMN